MTVALLGQVALGQAIYQPVDLYSLTLPSSYSDLQLGNSYSPVPMDASGGTVGTALFARFPGNVHSHAIRWNPDGTVVDLVPSNSPEWGYGFGIDGSVVVGGEAPTTSNAAMWSGDASTYVSLHPAQLGFAASDALGAGGSQQVGYAGVNGNDNHAMLWTGSAASAVDLQPKNSPVFNTTAIATDGVHQVGYGYVTDGTGHTRAHPLLWSGTADSMVDLTPTQIPGLLDAKVYGVSGDQQVGEADSPTTVHAMLWTGTADSAVDLHPLQFAQFTESVAYATNGSEQVGAIFNGPLWQPSSSHAVIWFGTAASAVDLQLDLPSQFVSSTAYNIDSAGDVFGIATDASGVMHAVEWTQELPEPSGITLVAFAAIGLLRRGRR
jgi:hypothetical protein